MATSQWMLESGGATDLWLTEGGDYWGQEDHTDTGVGTAQMRFLRTTLRKSYEMTRTGPA